MLKKVFPSSSLFSIQCPAPTGLASVSDDLSLGAPHFGVVLVIPDLKLYQRYALEKDKSGSGFW